MIKTFNSKIAELEQEKSELDLSFLQAKKQEYEDRMFEILDSKNNESDNNDAESQLNEARFCRAKIKEIERKIQNNSKILDSLDQKIAYYKEWQKKLDNIPLYKETKEWIIEIFWQDMVEYAEETCNEELLNKLRKRTLKPEEYTNILENDYPQYLERKHQEKEEMYKELFAPLLKKKTEKWESQPAPKTIISLPIWLSEQLNEELKDNKNISVWEIENFLKKELKKNSWQIKISHIKNKFWNKSDFVIKYLENLIKNYPEFIIIDNPEADKEERTTTHTKNQKLLSSVSTEEIEEHKNERLRKLELLSKLEKIWETKTLRSRIWKYLDLFEKLDCNFADKNEFAPQLYNVITTYSHIEIEKEIIKTLTLLIQGNLRIEKTWLYKYNVFRFNRDNRRMLAYPNWEIFKICPHEEYEEIINTQPPLEKIK